MPRRAAAAPPTTRARRRTRTDLRQLLISTVAAAPAPAALPHDADVVVIAVRRADLPQLLGSGCDVARWFGVDLDATLAQVQFTAATATTASLPLAGLPVHVHGEPQLSRRPMVLFVGVGEEQPDDWRRAGAAVAAASRKATHVYVIADDTDHTDALTVGLILGSWKPDKPGVSKPPPPPPAFTICGADPDVVQGATRVAQATVLARELASTPPNIKNPAWMARQVHLLADGRDGLSVEVWDDRALREQGFGGHLAVGSGSDNPPRLVTLTWAPPSRRGGSGAGRHVVLVGKGITFDTGGISIKPREAMVPMKTDMSGAAAVLAATLAAAQAQLPHRVTAVLALAENAVGGSSYRPGDIVTIWGGRTVEVANTDAEGRMVLADALAWACAHLHPDVLVDVATLTGNATLGLGRGHGAMFSDDNELAAALVRAGEQCGERVWRLPLVADYLPAIESGVADLRHVPQRNVYSGGAVTAALFLREFVDDVPWVHLDIAGPARAERGHHEISKGATGYGARLLVQWLTDL